MSGHELSSQQRRYGITIDTLVMATGKSVPTIYNWQRSNPGLLDAVSQHARNAAWLPEHRQHAALRNKAAGIALPLYADISDDSGEAPLEALTHLMFCLSGVDLWLLKSALRKVAEARDPASELCVEYRIVSDMTDLQIALAEGDIALVDEINASVSANVSLVDRVAGVTALHLMRWVVQYIDGERKAVGAALARIS